MKQLDVEVTAGTGRDCTVTIHGPRDALRELAALIRSPAYVVATVRKPTGRYLWVDSVSLASIVLEPSDSAALVSWANDRLLISGSFQARDVLANNIEFVSNQDDEPPNSKHIHIEHYPGNIYIDADSLPMVAAVED